METLIEVEMPMIPNFLRLKTGSVVPISDFKDSALRKIGKEWTEALVKCAKKRRK